MFSIRNISSIDLYLLYYIGFVSLENVFFSLIQDLNTSISIQSQEKPITSNILLYSHYFHPFLLLLLDLYSRYLKKVNQVPKIHANKEKEYHGIKLDYVDLSSISICGHIIKPL